MILRVYGGEKDDPYFSAHGYYERGVDDPVSSCPFCGSTDINVSNTHTPYYTAHCDDCGAAGPTRGPKRQPRGLIKTKKRCEKLHREAFNAAIAAWNKRD